MLSYCLRCKEKSDSKNTKVVKKPRKNNGYIKLFATIKNQDLSKSKKLADYLVD